MSDPRSPSHVASSHDRSAGPLELGRPFGIEDLWQVAVERRIVSVSDAAYEAIARARAPIDAIVAAGDAARPVYGVNTGFGAMAETRIGAADIVRLQQNLIRSHCCGVGPELSVPQVRAMMLLRAQVIALGHSGVRRECIDLLVALLNAGVHPCIPAQGSVGASGDLAPLAHLALTLIGEGQARYQGELMSSSAALGRAGLAPIELAAKEGIALINGTQYMTALGALALRRARELCVVADIAGAVCIEALKASQRPFDARLMAVRPHPGQAIVAGNMRALLGPSEITLSHAHCGKVQDPYSLRCIPQVHGATRDALGFAEAVIVREMESVTDNPTVFLGGPEDEDDVAGAAIISGGNFHGQPVALALDLGAIAVAELANISERRVEQLVNPALSTGLTPFLAPNSGLCSGFMIAQVASASLVSENKVLAHPASVDSIPSNANREDHVSMGSISARKLVQIVDNVANALAIELMAAVQGIDQRLPLCPSRGVEAARSVVRERVPTLTDDRPLYRDFALVAELVETGELRQRVEAAIGPLG
jgi:histidine ammonia-lyase